MTYGAASRGPVRVGALLKFFARTSHPVCEGKSHGQGGATIAAVEGPRYPGVVPLAGFELRLRGHVDRGRNTTGRGGSIGLVRHPRRF